MKKTLGCIRKADHDFSLIESGDRVAVGVSGGKDSLLLLHALSLYRQFSHKDFSLYAITVTLGLEPFDLSRIRALCEQLDIKYIVKETEIGKIIFEYRQEKNPCALCAKMRRAVLANTCVEYNINKLALGHHREDAIETLLMSLFNEGRFKTFHPKTRMSSVVKSPCPADGNTDRQKMKDLMRELRKVYPDVNERFLHALQQDHYDLWQKDDSPSGNG